MGEYMAKEWAKAFYKSAKWRKCRKAYIEHRRMIDGGACEVCKKEQGYIVHHTEKLDASSINDPEVALNHRKLRYECKKCHDDHDGHGVGTKIKPNCYFDKKGQPISIREVDMPPLK